MEGNAAIIEDQYAIYDTQEKAFDRYSKVNTDPQSQFASSAQCIEPGQSFWVKMKNKPASGCAVSSLVIQPNFINNDGPAAEFVRSAEEGVSTIILETENAFGATRSLLRFHEGGDAEGYVDGDLSHLSSTSVKRGELAVQVGEERYVAKSLPLETESELFVRSRANSPTTLRVVSVTGDPGLCAHITDHETGAVLLLKAGQEIQFTLESTTPPRAGLRSSPKNLATPRAWLHPVPMRKTGASWWKWVAVWPMSWW